MKKVIIIIIAILGFNLISKAQIYDGITQPSKYRIWTSISQPLNDESATLSFFTGYKCNITDWFNVTGVANYNVSNKAFSPSVWLNFKISDWFYVLSRNTYDIKNSAFKETLSATIKLPKGFMVDATCDNLLVNDAFCKGDRLQLVAGWGSKAVIFNAGYSIRDKKGAIANIRFKLTSDYWLQFKYDGGAETIAVNMAYHF